MSTDDFFDRLGKEAQSSDVESSNSVGLSRSAKKMAKNFANKGKMWAVANDRQFFACDAAVDELPPGQYLIRHCEARGFYFSKKEINLDTLIDLPDDNTTNVISGIEKFWHQKDLFTDMGFLWKRGVLLWGPPGSGKTSCLQQLSQMFIDRGGISVYASEPGHDAMGLLTLRTIEPNRPLLVMLEDIDSIVKRHGETELLALLDGELQIDNVVFVATTNYPELLDKRLINRPSRFDQIFYIGMPEPHCREVYLLAKNPRLQGTPDLAKWIEATDGFSIAHMKELVVAVECLEQPFDEAVERLKKMKHTPSSEDSKEEFGFTNG